MIRAANRFDLREMIHDRRLFIQQLNSQFGGVNVNDLISMQIDEFIQPTYKVIKK